MFRKMILAVALLCAPAAAAQDAFRPGAPPIDSNPPPSKNMCWTGTAWAACTAANPLPVMTTQRGGTDSNQVQGTAANGSPAIGNPNLVAGSDGTNTRTIRTDNTGNVGTFINGTTTRNVGDAAPRTSGLTVNAQNQVWNGSSLDFTRDANTASGTTGIGLLGTGSLGYDGALWRGVRVDGNGVTIVKGSDGNASTLGGSFFGIGGYASGPLPTAVTTGQGVRGWYGLNGQAVVAVGGGQAASAISGTFFNFMGDSANALRPLAVGMSLFDGPANAATYTRSASDANATIGTGLLGAGILGQYSATLPTYTTGQFGTLAMTNRGVLQTVLSDAFGNPYSGRTPADGQGVAFALPTYSQTVLANGAVWDLARTVQGSDGTGKGVNSVAETPNSAAGAGIVPKAGFAVTALPGKAGPGNFYGATMTNPLTGGVAGYLVVVNIAAPPAAGTALTTAQVMQCAPIAATNGTATAASAGGTGIPDYANTGQVALASTSCRTYTPMNPAPEFMRIRSQ